MGKQIYSPKGFQRWAENEKGPRWFENQDILNLYGKEQIMELFPQFFLKHSVPYQLVKNIFNLDKSFDASKVNLNENRLLAEVNGIFKNDNSRNERSYQQVLEHTIMGHKLEQYLIDNNSFIDDKRKYKDVLSPQGFSVDCKVVSSYHSGTAAYLVNKVLYNEAKYPNSPKTNFLVIYQKLGDTYEYRETVEIF